MNENKTSYETRQGKSNNIKKKFHTYNNDKSGISFKYQDNWIEAKDGLIRNKLKVKLYNHGHSKEFSVSRLPPRMSFFIKRWRSNTAIYCVLNSNESIVEDVKVNKYIIDNEETVSLITSSSSKKTIFEYILVLHKERYYLIIISSSYDNKRRGIDNNNDQIKKILESFKFLD